MPTASLILTEFAPTVSTPVVVTPLAKALTLTAFAPSIVIGTVVTVPVATLTVTEFAPTVSTPVVVTPGVVALVLTAFAPTVTATDNIKVTPPTATLILTTFKPGVTATLSTITTVAAGIGLPMRRRLPPRRRERLELKSHPAVATFFAFMPLHIRMPVGPVGADAIAKVQDASHALRQSAPMRLIAASMVEGAAQQLRQAVSIEVVSGLMAEVMIVVRQRLRARAIAQPAVEAAIQIKDGLPRVQREAEEAALLGLGDVSDDEEVLLGLR